MNFWCFSHLQIKFPHFQKRWILMIFGWFLIDFRLIFAPSNPISAPSKSMNFDDVWMIFDWFSHLQIQCPHLQNRCFLMIFMIFWWFPHLQIRCPHLQNRCFLIILMIFLMISAPSNQISAPSKSMIFDVFADFWWFPHLHIRFPHFQIRFSHLENGKKKSGDVARTHLHSRFSQWSAQARIGRRTAWSATRRPRTGIKIFTRCGRSAPYFFVYLRPLWLNAWQNIQRK